MVAHIQSTQEQVLAAPANSAGAYATLLTDTITLAAGDKLLVDAFISALGTAAGSQNLRMRIRINGTTWRSAGQGALTSALPNMLASASLTGEVLVGTSGLIAGTNTIDLDWRDDSGTTQLSITPANDGEGATMRLMRWMP